MSPNYQFWLSLLEYRAEHSISQKEVAQRMGVTQSCIAKLESRAPENLRIGDIFAYAVALGLKVSINTKKDKRV